MLLLLGFGSFDSFDSELFVSLVLHNQNHELLEDPLYNFFLLLFEREVKGLCYEPKKKRMKAGVMSSRGGTVFV